jgi:hypothetical protein
MRRFLLPVSVLCLVLAVSVPVHPRDEKHPGKRFYRPWTPTEFGGLDIPLPDHLKPDLMHTAAADTYLIVHYDFETLDWQGWTQLDRTAQIDTFWHVDDFDGLGGGDFGGLVPLEGTKSMWCGARPGDDEYMCSWASAPGYGNSWNQTFTTPPIPVTNPVTLSYKIRYDTEAGHDIVRVEFEHSINNSEQLASYDGKGESVGDHEFYVNGIATKIRFHFYSDGAWDDQDGLHNTDGAVIVDSLTVTDNDGFYDYEDFESADIGDKQSGIWQADVPEPFGINSGLAIGLVASDPDPCNNNYGTQIVFFIYDSPIWIPGPGLPPTPFCRGAGGVSAPCQNEAVVSPVIDMTRYSSGRDENQDAEIPSGELGDLGGALLRFTVYDYLPLQNLVFYTWHVRSIVDGCPGDWRDWGYWIPWSNYGYVRSTYDITRFIESDVIQVSLGVVDMCDAWYMTYGTCEEHTSAPWFDNVSIQRYSTAGPLWSWRDLDIFQDNFPEEEFDIESYVRADAANDLNPNDDPVIRPGDSAVVDCTAPLAGGLATEGNGEPAVFCHVLVTHMGPDAKTPPSGAVIQGDWGTYWGMDGSWTVIQMDTALTSSGNPAPDKFCVDLHDSLFTRGFRIDYYFKARDLDGDWSTLPERAQTHDAFFEFTCLPTLASDILYVDDFHGRGTLEGMVEIYMDWSFRYVLPADNYPDRYDVNNPSSLVGNGLGSRARNHHLTTAYKKLIWDSGNLQDGTICTGDAETSGKSPDCQVVVDWLSLSPHDVGLWVMGDDIAYDLDNQAAACALDLMSIQCGVTLVDNSYFELTGGRTSGGIATPLVHTVVGVPYQNPLHPDSFYADGGCPVVNAFDVLDKTESSQYTLKYPDYGGQPCYAGIQNELLNDAGFAQKTMWFGFSFMYIRDATPPGPHTMVRNWIMAAVIEWMGNEIGYTGHDEMPAAYSLSQNFPNPFNPVTTIRYSMKGRGIASLKIYNVAGQLVRTLVNEIKDPGVYKVDWDGRNNRGSTVASGVYFYKMEAKEFRSTKKMVLLR